ncbi:MAG: protein translocase subunit SecF [Actinomycetota bacterium]|jgi:preprotein translocase subunit SecF
MSDITKTADAEAAATVFNETVHQRRTRWGRLYHGETAVDFYGRRSWGLIFSGVLLVVTIISLVFNGLNLGIDFEGGVAWEVPAQSVTVDQAKAVLDANGIDSSNAKVQTLTSDSGTRLRIQVGDQTPEVVATVQQALADAAGVEVQDVSSTSVSSSWGRSITEKAVRALVIFLVLVAMFISWRFEWRMALAAIIAMVHDVLISVGVYSVFGFEVTPATVVAFLTILGFSLYDTIVVFDKVNENTERYAGARAPYADTMNVSMNQVLMRSINTSLAAVLPVLSLLVIGSGIMGATALREFALALLVGLVTGSYSSIFIAAPVLTMFKERDPRFKNLRDDHATGAELERLVLGGSPEGHRREVARARRAAVASGDADVVITASSTPESVLTHPPRPRKKKRR